MATTPTLPPEVTTMPPAHPPGPTARITGEPPHHPSNPTIFNAL